MLLSFDFNTDLDPAFHSNAASSIQICGSATLHRAVDPHLEIQLDKLNLRRCGSVYAEIGS
jgi:hypothetical protein